MSLYNNCLGTYSDCEQLTSQ